MHAYTYGETNVPSLYIHVHFKVLYTVLDSRPPGDTSSLFLIIQLQSHLHRFNQEQLVFW